MSKKVYEGGQIITDFENLFIDYPPPPCSCASPALRRVLWTFKMQDAIEGARRFSDPIILAVEYRQQGSRLFLAASRKHIFHYLCYLRLNRPQFSTWHEIVSGLTPMRLYFDFDFYYQTNRNLNIDSILSDFRDLISKILIDYFKTETGEAIYLKFIDLDATTREKFSRHLILHLQNQRGREIHFFKNPKEIRDLIDSKIVPILKRENFYVQPKPGLRADDPRGGPLIDTSVYGEKAGQNFRLLGSPKFGRENILRYLNYDHDRQHEFEFHDPNCRLCERIFLGSLITASTMLEFGNRFGDQSMASNRSPGQSAKSNRSANRSIDQSIDDHLISTKDLEIYRRDITWSKMDIDLFGIRSAFYYEIYHFNILSKLFHPKFAQDLLNDLVEASRKSEYYENLPDDRSLLDYVRLYRDFKDRLSIDPIDWDALYGYAADLLDIFRSNLNRDEESIEDDYPDHRFDTDLNTMRKLRAIYSKFSKWEQQSASQFFDHDYDRAKQFYDPYMQELIQSKKSIIPQEFPLKLTKNNFRYVYRLLADLENWELQRRKWKKEENQRRLVRKFDKLEKALVEEERFRQFLETTLDRVMATGRLVVTVQFGVRDALLHSKDLVKDYEKRMQEMMGNKDNTLEASGT